MFGNFLGKIFGRQHSNQTARNRLQMVLVQDRSGLTPQEMDYFQKDLMEVLSKYFVLERQTLDIEWERSDNSTALLINTPVVGRSRSLPKVVPAVATS